jgi:membrane fusion protein (multidrug efflux system)
MADSRNIVTLVSLAVALLAVGWGVYVTRERQPAEPDQLQATRDARSAAPDARTSGTHSGGGAGPGSAMASQPAAPARGAAVAVITAEARTERVTSPLTALGTARANEAVEVTSKASNIVAAVRFRDGERVQKGQVLVELDSAQARADLAAAEAARADSASQVKRSRELLATKVISDAQFEQLEATLKTNEARVDAARSRLDDTVIRAPFAGRVGLRRVSVGTLVNPGTTIATLDDSSLIKVDFAVPENFLSVLREGLKVYALSAAFPDREFEGTIAGVDSRVDPVSRSVTVRAVVPNPDGKLKPGMFLNVRVAPDARDAIMIPEAALMPEQSRQFLYVVEDGRAIRREVRIGRREPGRVEVVAGLAPGERVIVEGTQKVREGGPVRELAREQAPQPEEARR